MDNRFSRRWSTNPDSMPAAPASSPIHHVSSQNAAAPSYSNKSLPTAAASKQRWSTVATSHLSIVETINYDEKPSPPPSIISITVPTRTLTKRKRSIANLKAIMRHIFPKKETELVPDIPSEHLQPTKPALTKSRSFKTSKSDPIVLKNISDKETHLWNRLSIVVRPPRKTATSEPPAQMPKRIDSGVDIHSLKEVLSANSARRDRSTASLPTFPSHARHSSDTTTITISGPPLLLTTAERTHLINELLAAQKLILSQTAETETFSTNLAGLLWSKEHNIMANKRINEETRKEMVATMAKVRDVTAKTFARKGAFFERSLSVLEKLLNELNASPTSASSAKSQSDTSSSRSTSPDSILSSTITLTNSHDKYEVPLTLTTLRSGLQTLKADLTAHSHLDPALRNGVVRPTKEEKFPTSESEKVAMKRFVRFVDERVKKAAAGYWEMGRWVRGVEGWVDDLEERGGC